MIDSVLCYDQLHDEAFWLSQDKAAQECATNEFMEIVLLSDPAYSALVLLANGRNKQ